MLISQMVGDIRNKITRDAMCYLQELERSFEFSFGAQVDRVERD